MNCPDVRPLLHAFIDDELDLVTSIAVEKHVHDCAGCTQALGERKAVRAAVGPDLYAPAPVALRRRVAAAVRQEERSAGGAPVQWSRWLALAACVALAVGAVWGAMRLGTSSAEGQLAQEVVASHVRSLMADHLADVASTDQHTVKPWFAGKLDFAPNVQDLSSDGFPLIGGRLDYLAHRPVAALVYRRRLHDINLIQWPEEGQPDQPPRSLTRQGYHLITWRRAGLTCWAVSDVAETDLRQFAGLFQGRRASTTPSTEPQ